MYIIHFECPPFDVFFSSFQTAIIFYIKRSFYALLTPLTLSLNHATIAWFSTYNKHAVSNRKVVTYFDHNQRKLTIPFISF